MQVFLSMTNALYLHKITVFLTLIFPMSFQMEIIYDAFLKKINLPMVKNMLDIIH